MPSEEILNQHPEAVEVLLRKALNRKNGSELSGKLRAEVTTALAESLIFQQRLEEARDLVRAVLAEHPRHKSALWWDAFFAFKMEDHPWQDAWEKLESCWATWIPPDRVWDGSPLNGRTILWEGVFGLGDQIQFIRFAPLLKAAGAGRVIISADPKLFPLFRTLTGADGPFSPVDLVPNTMKTSVPYDVGISMIGVPGRFGATPETVAGSVPYLHATQDSIEEARAVIGPRGQSVLNVGICWQSAAIVRSMALESMRPLRELPGVRLFGLGEQSSIEKECADFGIVSLGSDIATTAGAIAALDLIISVDTMIVHLAGSLGRPVWVILHRAADFRWPRTGERTPWYRNMRIFRPEGSDREGLVQRIAGDLERLLRLNC